MGFHSHPAYRYGTSVAALYAAAGAATVGGELLAGETNAMGIDFTYHTDITKQHYISDTVTPANNYNGAPFEKLTYTSPSLKMTRQSDGVWRYSNHNLLLQSQTLDNVSWAEFGGSTTAANSTTAPDGTSTADTISFGAGATSTHYQNLTGVVVGVAYQMSVWAKTASSTKDFRLDFFDGSVNSTSADKTATTTWQRFTFAITGANPSGTPNFGLKNGSGGGAGDVIFWGAQIKRSPVNDAAGYTYATGYLATTSSAVYDLPYEWNAALASQGILIEEARTNVCLRSQEFGNAAWAEVGADSGVASDAATAPDGTTTADNYRCTNTNTAEHTRYQSLTITNGNNTYSVFLKPNGVGAFNYVFVGSAAGGDHGSWFNVSTGAVGNTVGTIVSKSITSAGNGWYLCTVTANETGSQPFFLSISTTDNGPGSGRGSEAGVTNAGVFVWGLQCEAGAFPTSPIHTIAAIVTRVVDNISMATSVTPHSAAVGTLVASFMPKAVLNTAGVNQYIVAKFQVSGVQDFSLLQIDNSSIANVLSQTGGSSTFAANLGSVVKDTNYKIGMAWATTNFGASLNGSITTQLSGSPPTTQDQYVFGNRLTDTARAFNGYLKQITYLKRRALDAELQTRTT